MFTRLFKRSKRTPNPFRPTRRKLVLESLEERATPSATVYDIPGQGVYLYNSGNGSVSHISTRDAQSLAINDGPGGYNTPGEVVAAFSDGVYTYFGSTWTKLSSAYADKVDIDNHGNVAGDFPFLGPNYTGVWLYHASSGVWSHLSIADASLLRISQNAVVTVEFGSTGVWVYNNGWSQLTAANATSMDVDEAGNFVGEFPGQGVWIHYVSGTWSHISSFDASQVAIGGGTVAASFKSASFPGLWLYNETTNTWSRPTTATPSVLAADSWGEVAGEYTSGVWNYKSGSWTHVSWATNVSQLDIGVSYYLI
jgi:hypothetical protein